MHKASAVHPCATNKAQPEEVVVEHGTCLVLVPSESLAVRSTQPQAGAEAKS